MNRMLPAVLIALCALMGIALAFQRSALNDARRDTKGGRTEIAIPSPADPDAAPRPYGSNFSGLGSPPVLSLVADDAW